MTTVEILYERLKPVIFPVLMLMFAMFLGVVSYISPKASLGLVVLSFYSICLFTKPMWAYFIMIITVLNFFGMTTEHFMALPGAFKLRDLALFSLFVPQILALTRDKTTISRLSSPLNKYIILIVAFIFLIVFYTVMEYDVSIASSLRIARKYFFYLSYFIVMYFVKNDKDFKLLIYTFIAFGVIQALLLIGQFSIGLGFKIMPGINMDYQTLSGMYLPRIYINAGGTLIAIFFGITFWVYQLKRQKKYLFLAVILGIASVLEFSRANWIRQFVIIVLPLFFLVSSERKKTLMFLLVLSCCVFIVLLSAKLVGFDIFSVFSKIFTHMQSIYYDFVHKTGTIQMRLEDSAERIKLFLQKPLLGVGFLHYIASEESVKAVIVKDMYIETIDSGILSMLVTMGSIGTSVFFLISFVFIKRCLYAIRVVKPIFYRGVILGCFGYFVGGCITFVTLPFFTNVSDIPLIALTFALVEKTIKLHTSNLISEEN